MLYRERVNADKRVSQPRPGTTRRDVKPLHINRDLWDSLCDWWNSEKFKSMSAQNKENRTHGDKIVHTTGAKPYIIFRKVKNYIYIKLVCYSSYWLDVH